LTFLFCPFCLSLHVFTSIFPLLTFSYSVLPPHVFLVFVFPRCLLLFVSPAIPFNFPYLSISHQSLLLFSPTCLPFCLCPSLSFSVPSLMSHPLFFLNVFAPVFYLCPTATPSRLGLFNLPIRM
jgi:hypothetical protein